MISSIAMGEGILGKGGCICISVIKRPPWLIVIVCIEFGVYAKQCHRSSSILVTWFGSAKPNGIPCADDLH